MFILGFDYCIRVLPVRVEREKGVLFILISAYLCFKCFLQSRCLLESLSIKQDINRITLNE